MAKYSKQDAIMKWDKQYEKDNSFVRYMSKIYFSRVFQDSFMKITKGVKGKVLEPACGEAIMSSRLAKLGYEVTGLEASRKALELARLNFEKIGAKGTLVEGDLFNMDFPSESFDITWNQGVIEELGERSEEAIKEMFRVTKKGGYVVIFVPAKYSPLQFYKIFLNKINMDKLYFWYGQEQRFYSKKLLHEHIFNATGVKPTIYRIFLTFGFSMVGYIRKQ